ncbi:MAG: hypothetical protein FWD11_10530, partial [Micrococcales bacterium]|nr:hypothetical protein [Micrococcales bacterium]
RLEQNYNHVLDSARGATVYVVGYPPAAEYDDVDNPSSPGRIKMKHREEAAALIEDLNAKIADTVAKVNAERVANGEPARLVFVDPGAPDSPFIGHSASDPDPYVHTITVPPMPYSYHPNIAGNNAMADLMGEYMLGYR